MMVSTHNARVTVQAVQINPESCNVEQAVIWANYADIGCIPKTGDWVVHFGGQKYVVFSDADFKRIWGTTLGDALGSGPQQGMMVSGEAAPAQIPSEPVEDTAHAGSVLPPAEPIAYGDAVDEGYKAPDLSLKPARAKPSAKER